MNTARHFADGSPPKVWSGRGALQALATPSHLAHLEQSISSRGKRHFRQLGEFGDEPVLEFRIAGFTGRPFLSKVMPIAAADQRSRLVADGQPALSALAGVEVDRSAWTAHLRACPTGIDRIAQDLRRLAIARASATTWSLLSA